MSRGCAATSPDNVQQTVGKQWTETFCKHLRSDAIIAGFIRMSRIGIVNRVFSSMFQN